VLPLYHFAPVFAIFLSNISEFCTVLTKYPASIHGYIPDWIVPLTFLNFPFSFLLRRESTFCLRQKNYIFLFTRKGKKSNLDHVFYKNRKERYRREAITGTIHAGLRKTGDFSHFWRPFFISHKEVRMATKYVFVTGGVVSGLGKGITAASLAGF
jgi:hypothetical protein